MKRAVVGAVWLVAFGALADCGLNPQPFPPQPSNSSTAGGGSNGAAGSVGGGSGTEPGGAGGGMAFGADAGASEDAAVGATIPITASDGAAFAEGGADAGAFEGNTAGGDAAISTEDAAGSDARPSSPDGASSDAVAEQATSIDALDEPRDASKPSDAQGNAAADPED